uniref:Mos1 transposase HTH domain-containing protein n=1 Tax=Eptatretus burgeri TaxID=7764 RepID=A0A8C4QX94_EPTBU
MVDLEREGAGVVVWEWGKEKREGEKSANPTGRRARESLRVVRVVSIFTALCLTFFVRLCVCPSHHLLNCTEDVNLIGCSLLTSVLQSHISFRVQHSSEKRSTRDACLYHRVLTSPNAETILPFCCCISLHSMLCLRLTPSLSPLPPLLPCTLTEWSSKCTPPPSETASLFPCTERDFSLLSFCSFTQAPRTYCVHPAARETPCRYNNHTVVLYTSSSLSLRARSCEQRANLKFLAKLGKTPYESFTMLQQVYGEETMSRTRAFEWHKRFKEGRGEVEDDPRSGRPSTSRTVDNIECVKQMVRADRRLTVRMIGEELSINKDTVWSIITENLEMRTVYSKMVPKLLSKDQKQQRVTVC